MHPFVRRGVTAMVVLAASLGVGGCTASGPMGLRKDGDHLVVVLGRQCVPASYLTELEVADINEKRNEAVDPPVWKIKADQARAVPEVVVGTAPDGYTVVAYNIAAQGFTKRVSLQVTFGGTSYATTIDVGKIHGGRVLTAEGSQVSPDEFRKKYGC
jgi:hypothetical protein